MPADKLPEAYAKAIAGADSGAVVPVFTLKGAGDRDQFCRDGGIQIGTAKFGAALEAAVLVEDDALTYERDPRQIVG